MGIKLTVFFEEPFWVGIFERVYGDRMEVAKVVFGSEPKDFEVYNLILQDFNDLRFSRPVVVDEEAERRINPKRMQRKIRREVSGEGVGTKAQQAVKAGFEAAKQERKHISKKRREADEQLRYEMRQAKKKEKKKGH